MTKTTANWPGLFATAKAAGLNAAADVNPTAMTVVGGVVGQRPKAWHVPEGMCGFAWVNVKPGTHSFARWLKKTGAGRADSYYGGVTVWISEHGQSHERKAAHARAMAECLRGVEGLRAYAGDRLD